MTVISFLVVHSTSLTRVQANFGQQGPCEIKARWELEIQSYVDSYGKIFIISIDNFTGKMLFIRIYMFAFKILLRNSKLEL